MADRVLERDAKSRKVRAARSLPRRKGEATKRQTRNEKMADIRDIVISRCGEQCETCLHAMGEHAHHVLSGVGRRRADEAANTVPWVCSRCHRELHANDPVRLEAALNYCLGSQMFAAARELRQRFDKVTARRGA